MTYTVIVVRSNWSNLFFVFTPQFSVTPWPVSATSAALRCVQWRPSHRPIGPSESNFHWWFSSKHEVHHDIMLCFFGSHYCVYVCYFLCDFMSFRYRTGRLPDPARHSVAIGFGTLNSLAKLVGEAGWPWVFASIGMSQSGSLPFEGSHGRGYDQTKLDWILCGYRK